MSAMTSDVYGQDVTSQVKGLNTGAWVMYQIRCFYKITM
jgi:hypothetical protein